MRDNNVLLQATLKCLITASGTPVITEILQAPIDDITSQFLHE